MIVGGGGADLVFAIGEERRDWKVRVSIGDDIFLMMNVGGLVGNALSLHGNVV